MDWLRLAVYGLYEVRHLLGEGGASQCFEATTGASERVALKAFRYLARPGQTLLDYEDEVAAYRDLKGVPNTVVLRGAFHIDFEYCSRTVRAHFLELELYDASLQNRIRERSLKEPEMCVYALDLLRALDGIHSRGYMHLDVTPANILLKGDRAYLGDFGLATRAEDPRGTEGFSVTALWYRAPDVFGRKSAGPGADIWSAGCVLMAMACAVYERAAFPWTEETEEAQYKAISSSMARGGAMAHLPRAPARLVGCIDAMLRMDPGARPSIGAVIERLEALSDEICQAP